MTRCSGRRGRDEGCYKLLHFSARRRERRRGGWRKDWEKLRKFDTDTALPRAGHGQNHSCHLFDLLLTHYLELTPSHLKLTNSSEKEGATVT